MLDLALAPAFLIVGIGSLLNVLTTRLSRAVERSRTIEAQSAGYDEDMRRRARAELPLLGKRITLINRAIFCCVASALFVAITVALLFIGPFITFRLGTFIALLFVGAMLLIVAGLILFLMETRVALRGLRARGTAHMLPEREEEAKEGSGGA